MLTSHLCQPKWYNTCCVCLNTRISGDLVLSKKLLPFPTTTVHLKISQQKDDFLKQLFLDIFFGNTISDERVHSFPMFSLGFV